MTQIFLVFVGLIAAIVLLGGLALTLVSTVRVIGTVIQIVQNPTLGLIAFRSLFQHRMRSALLGGAIALVTAGLVLVTGMSVGIKSTLLTSATTLMSGHLNVGGFYKATASQSAPVVTSFAKVEELITRDFPEIDYVVHRGRGWAKLVSDTGSVQAGIAGINIANEPGMKKIIVVKEGNIDDLSRIDSILLFEEQAEKLDAKVGDRLTISAATFRGTNNTVDVTVVAVAKSVGMLSSFNCFVNEAQLRKLYQLNEETTGALQIYLKDIGQVKPVQERMRKTLAAAGYGMLDPDPRAFWQKFDAVNHESWTGQKLDVTNWEEETSFIKWIVDILSYFATLVILILVVIIGVGIMMVVWISVRERTREIGTLRAVGMQRGSVLAMFVTEGFLLGLFGTVVGTIVGLVTTLVINAAQIGLPKSWQFVFMSERLIIVPTVGWSIFGVLFITAIITGISVIPSFLAARLKPISAMSHVG